MNTSIEANIMLICRFFTNSFRWDFMEEKLLSNYEKILQKLSLFIHSSNKNKNLRLAIISLIFKYYLYNNL